MLGRGAVFPPLLLLPISSSISTGNSCLLRACCCCRWRGGRPTAAACRGLWHEGRRRVLRQQQQQQQPKLGRKKYIDLEGKWKTTKTPAFELLLLLLLLLLGKYEWCRRQFMKKKLIAQKALKIALDANVGISSKPAIEFGFHILLNIKKK